MDLWMDVSKNDAGAVNSVLVGCRAHGSRAVFTSVADAKYWTSQHHRDLHRSHEPVGVEQLDSPTRPRVYSSPMKERITALLRANGEMTTRELSEQLGNSYKSANVLLNRLRHAAQVTGVKAGQETRWSLTNAA